MKAQSQQPRQPSQNEVQSLLNLVNAGQIPQAEHLARMLLKAYPEALMLHNVLGVSLEGQKKFEEAAASYRKVIAIDPGIAEIHFNLGVVLASLGRIDEAVASYRKAITLKPGLAVAHFNLGVALQEQGLSDQAIASYRKALAVEPGFYEAHGNLGAIFQSQGKLEEAVNSYRKALSIKPDAIGYFNLGTALRNAGLLEDAIQSFQKALGVDPGYAEAYGSLGDALWHQGKLNEAVESFHRALAIDPGNPAANYKLGVFLYDNAELERAIPHFERSQFDDWRERVLYCLYKTERYDEFREKLKDAISANNTSPLLATLSTHYAVNFGVRDEYNFCKDPLSFVFHSSIEPLAEPDSELLRDLLRDINHAEISARKQSRLHNGIQSSGNLFKRPEASFQKLAALVAMTIEKYREHFAAEDCMFIKAFPTTLEFSSSWYVKMRQGGHLGSHIHEEGWISGAVYLAIPQRISPEEGCIELSTHGDNYPQKHSNFPAMVVAPKVGDVCFFPSSVFHRTIPFSSDEERICIAFDLKPMKTRLSHMSSGY